MAYQITFAPLARRQIKKLTRDVQSRVLERIEELKAEPRPVGVKKLADEEEDLYRIRVGDYRVIYQIHDRELIVLIVKVGPRRDIYNR